jgi:hypothetical protein
MGAHLITRTPFAFRERTPPKDAKTILVLPGISRPPRGNRCALSAACVVSVALATSRVATRFHMATSIKCEQAQKAGDRNPSS